VPADKRWRWPKVWLVAGDDAVKVGQGDAWEFDVILHYRSPENNFDAARTWCITPPSHKNYQGPAILMLREKAWCSGYCKIEIFEIRPPVSPEKRDYLRGANQAVRDFVEKKATAEKVRRMGMVPPAEFRR